MAGYDNIKNHGFDKKTAEERRELARKAGKASGVARRKKANFRKTLNMLLTAKIDSPQWEGLLEQLGVDTTTESAMMMSMINEAINGNVKAAYFVAQYAGQSDKTDADEKEQSIRTDRAKRARDQEIGDVDESRDNIQDFLKAIRPSDDELKKIFDEEEVNSGEEKKETE